MEAKRIVRCSLEDRLQDIRYRIQQRDGQIKIITVVDSGEDNGRPIRVFEHRLADSQVYDLYNVVSDAVFWLDNRRHFHDSFSAIDVYDDDDEPPYDHLDAECRCDYVANDQDLDDVQAMIDSCPSITEY